jgi:alkanesulfonate monooxygenase SsuD/methylene tetrahydromethanopterin reductase-like flavin-dependent oxidoreductase (luciferase family)
MVTLHAITGGHFQCALGLGYREQEFAAFGIDRSERLPRTVELLKIVRPLVAGENVTFHGRFYSVDDIRIRPGSIIDPPPALVIGTGNVRGIRRAARLADGVYLTGYEPKSEIAGFVTAYREALGEVGRESRAGFAIRREMLFGESRKEALERGRAHWAHSLSALHARGLEQEQLPWVVEELERGNDSDDLPFILGTAEECAEQLAEYGRMGVDMTVFRFQIEGLALSEAIRLMERFGSRVIPLVQKALA